MTNEFEIRAYTIPDSGKEKNGDSYIFEFIQSEQLLLAIVADGVSRQPCDWLASENTCKMLMEVFKGSAHQNDIKNRLKESILQTNKFIIDTEGKCRKMASTLSAVVLDVKQNLFFYSNIGDSRIYRLINGKIQQLTKDDSVVTKEKVSANGGFRLVDKHTLTKAIGQENILVDVMVEPITLGEIIILATDGFYEARKASFNRIMEQFEESELFETNFKRTIENLETLRGDDFTVIMIKKK